MEYIVLLLLLAFTAVVGVIWLFTRGKLALRVIQILWGFLLGVFLLSWLVRAIGAKKELDQEDIYGEYIIDRSKYPGPQADWQYNHFRFEITPRHDFRLYLTEEARVTRTIAGRVAFLEAYQQPRIIIQVDSPRYHLVATNPTLYRETRSFYYVFNSPKFGNVFFKKGEWAPLNK